MFPQVETSTEELIRRRVNTLMRKYNDSLNETVRDFKDQWRTFWAADLTVEEMQMQLDHLAGITAVDQGTTTNALSAYFAKALRLITYVLGENTDAFNDGRPERTGVLQVTGQPYVEYFTPGWYYTVSNTGRIVVSGPCDYSVNNEE